MFQIIQRGRQSVATGSLELLEVADATVSVGAVGYRLDDDRELDRVISRESVR